MQEKRKLIPLKLAVLMALLSALSIVLGKLLAVNIGEVIRISFENLPILFAALAFGPLAGALVGLIADLVGCLIVGYAVNPFVTAGAVLVGVTAGGIKRFMPEGRLPGGAITVISVAAAHLNGSVITKTIGLAMYYGMPLGALMLWRALNYLLVGAVECVILTVLLKNRGVRMAISAIKPAPVTRDKEVNDGDEL